MGCGNVKLNKIGNFRRKTFSSTELSIVVIPPQIDESEKYGIIGIKLDSNEARLESDSFKSNLHDSLDNEYEDLNSANNNNNLFPIPKRDLLKVNFAGNEKINEERKLKVVNCRKECSTKGSSSSLIQIKQ